MKCDVFLDELERAAQSPKKTAVELQKDVVRRHWKSYTICDALWNVRNAWKEVTESCLRGVWKKLCPHLAVDFRGFDLQRRSKERLELARKVGLDEVEEDDVGSLLESISEELSVEELDELEKQWHQLEEEVEAEQHLTAPVTKKLMLLILQHFFGMLNDMLEYLEEVDPDYEQAGLTRRGMLANAAHYEQLLLEKRREATHASLDSYFRRKTSLP